MFEGTHTHGFFPAPNHHHHHHHHHHPLLTCGASGCEYVYNVYDDGKDVGFYMCNDRINALAVATITRDGKFDAVLGCQDKMVRVIQVR